MTAPEKTGGGILGRIRQEVERNSMRARNGIKMATGTGAPKLGVTPKDVVWRNGRATLSRYRNDDVTVRPPLLIVFSLVSKAYILDLTPGNSFVEHLIAAGFDVYLLDWGEADVRDAHNRLEYYCDDAIPAAVREVCKRSNTDEVSLLGYCFGGVLTLLYGAHHPEAPLRSFSVVACPVDFSKMPQASNTDMDVDSILDDDGNVPPSVMRASFSQLRPTAEITGYVDLWDKLWSDQYVAAHQAMAGWGNDHVAFPGAVAKQTAEMLVRDNGFVTGDLSLGGDVISLKNIHWPFLSVLGEKDHIVPPEAAGPVMDLVGSEDKTELRLKGGHIGIAVGRTAAKTTIPTIIDFLKRRSEVVS